MDERFDDDDFDPLEFLAVEHPPTCHMCGGETPNWPSRVLHFRREHPGTDPRSTGEETGLTRERLLEMPKRGEHLGFGYLGHAYRSDVTDKAVLQAANDLGVEEDDLFEWANSKPGRWFLNSHAPTRKCLDSGGCGVQNPAHAVRCGDCGGRIGPLTLDEDEIDEDEAVGRLSGLLKEKMPAEIEAINEELGVQREYPWAQGGAARTAMNWTRDGEPIGEPGDEPAPPWLPGAYASGDPDEGAEFDPLLFL